MRVGTLAIIALFLTVVSGCGPSAPRYDEAVARRMEEQIIQLFRDSEAVTFTIRGQDLPLRPHIVTERKALNRIAEALHVRTATSDIHPLSCTFSVEVVGKDDRGFSILGEGALLFVYPDLKRDSSNKRDAYHVDVDDAFIDVIHEVLGATFLETFLAIWEEEDRLKSAEALGDAPANQDTPQIDRNESR
jgi:hypothetical protein